MSVSRSRPRKQRLAPVDLSRVVGKVVELDATHWHAELQAAGFTEAYAAAERAAIAAELDRTATPAHALLAGLLEGA